MEALAFYIADGSIFFCGIFFILLESFLQLWAAGEKWRHFRILLILGILLVAISSTPLPLWLYIFWVFFLLLLFRAQAVKSETSRFRLRFLSAAVTIISLLAVALEIPYQRMPAPQVQSSNIIVVGDSISAGVGNGIEVWPDLLANNAHIEVTNLSRPGLTIAGAIEQAKKLQGAELADSTVIVEIGGNDILNGSDVRSFNEGLDELFEILCGARKILVFELPLPPFCNRYAKSQRTLVKKHHAALIPKKATVRIIRDSGATIDGLHLSQKGQHMMEELVRTAIFGKK